MDNNKTLKNFANKNIVKKKKTNPSKNINKNNANNKNKNNKSNKTHSFVKTFSQSNHNQHHKYLYKSKKLSKSAIMLIVSCAIIAVPVITFVVILLSASINTGKPILANRFKNDLVPSISANNITYIESGVSLIDGVEDCEVILKSAQLRVNVDTIDSLDKGEIVEIANEAFNVVTENLPISTYFKVGDTGEKMYDLAISVYNYSSPDVGDDFIYYIITKNSKMDSAMKQFISEPVSPDLAKELRGENLVAEEEEDIGDEESNE